MREALPCQEMYVVGQTKVRAGRVKRERERDRRAARRSATWQRDGRVAA
jgi:hypothetical protein